MHRVLTFGGRLIVFEPFISAASLPVYGLLHPEPVALRKPIDLRTTAPRAKRYYAAQGNATRLFFSGQTPPGWSTCWRVLHREAFSGFAYLLSGGYSRPAFYPRACWGMLRRLDDLLSRWPRWFGARCLVVLQPLAHAIPA
jgi:hypothetical protein